VTHAHLEAGNAEKFCKDAEDIVECIMKNPDAPIKGVVRNFSYEIMYNYSVAEYDI